MPGMQAPVKPGTVTRALARDRLGVPAVLFFVLADVAPLTVAAGVIPTAWILPASSAAAAAAGLCRGTVLRARRPQVYATIGLGANAITGQTTSAAPGEAR